MVLPPIVSDIESAGFDTEIKVTEAIVSQEPAIGEMGPGAAALAKAFDKEFAVNELACVTRAV